MIDQDQLDNMGYCVIRNQITDVWILKFKAILPDIFNSHHNIQLENNSDIKAKGLAFHVILSHSIFIEFLNELLNTGFIKSLKDVFFKNGDVILNSFSALNNIPNQATFASKAHRDIRFYTSDIPIMLNMLVMLDDFTEENGATLLLPNSHKYEEKPTDEYFNNNAIKVTGESGDVLLFNSNIWHAAGLNKSKKDRTRAG